MSDPTPAVPKRILVVDDNPDICAFMQAALGGAGYEVRIAAEGAQALAMLERRTADVIITDLFMPGQQGFETITRCRSEFPEMAIIAMSAGVVPGMQHDFLAGAAVLGVRGTLRKPFTAGQLLDTVAEVLQQG